MYFIVSETIIKGGKMLIQKINGVNSNKIYSTNRTKTQEQSVGEKISSKAYGSSSLPIYYTNINFKGKVPKIDLEMVGKFIENGISLEQGQKHLQTLSDNSSFFESFTNPELFERTLMVAKKLNTEAKVLLVKSKDEKGYTIFEKLADKSTENAVSYTDLVKNSDVKVKNAFILNYDDKRGSQLLGIIKNSTYQSEMPLVDKFLEVLKESDVKTQAEHINFRTPYGKSLQNYAVQNRLHSFYSKWNNYIQNADKEVKKVSSFMQNNDGHTNFAFAMINMAPRMAMDELKVLQSLDLDTQKAFIALKGPKNRNILEGIYFDSIGDSVLSGLISDFYKYAKEVNPEEVKTWNKAFFNTFGLSD